MKTRLVKFILSLILLSLSFESCIHEYPHGTGKIPSTSFVSIEVNHSLIWDRRNHFVDFQTRAQSDKPYHFVLEAMRDGMVVCKDEISISAEEFSAGKFTHTFSKALSNEVHQIAVWFDMEDENGQRSFSFEDLSGIHLKSSTIKNSVYKNSGYVNTIIDLNDHIYTDNKCIQVDLLHAGARFEIVATDVNQFIAQQKEALNQGDQFNLEVVISDSSPTSLNAYDSSTFFNGNSQVLSGALFFPFAEYDELNIAEGFIFCKDEDYVTMKILVYNGAKAIVTQTPSFSFPIKNGRITTVRADFLSFPIDGSLGIDNVWNGDIEIDLDDD